MSTNDTKLSTSDKLIEIQERHEATLLIDWEKEFNPEWQPQSLSNAQHCHKDRGYLLERIKELEAEIKLVISWAENWDVPFLEDSEWLNDMARIKATLEQDCE